LPDAASSTLAEGSRVTIVCRTETVEKPVWFCDLIEDLIVDDPDSPSDYALNLEHYRYGTPKR